MLGFSLQQAGAENGTYMAYCSSNLTNRYDGLGPLYYCGKLVVNGMFVAAGVGVSRVYEKYAFRNAVIRNLKNSSIRKLPEIRFAWWLETSESYWKEAESSWQANEVEELNTFS